MMDKNLNHLEELYYSSLSGFLTILHKLLKMTVLDVWRY